MARMIALDPALTVPLPAKGWVLMATEAGRYATGLLATVQAHNGSLQACQQVPLAHPKKWEPFVQDVADRSGCTAEAVVAAIHELMEAIEVLLRVRRTPRAKTKQDGTPVSPSRHPLVQVNGRFLRDIVTDALAALASANDPPTRFVRGSELVRMPPDAAHATPLSVAALRVLLDHAADFMEVHWDEDEGETKIPARPPRDVCESILAIPPHHAFPRLVSIRSVPVILPAGRLLATQGYDQDSGILLRLHGLDGARDNMPSEEAKAWLFHELLGDFPFADEASRAHSMALLLEPFVRPIIQGPTPLYLIDAPIRGTGKGLLADVACLLATGRKADVMALVRSDAEEHEKRITALLLAGAQWVLIDNATSLASAPLAAVLTTTQWRGRRLGKSEMVDVPNDATWVATGNNVTLSDEIARRTIPIRLDPGVERPEERTGFSHPELVKWASEHRSILVSACLSLVRMWLDAGCPAGQTTLGSYESWARVLGGIFGVSGVCGFLAGRERLYSEADRETADWCALCERWWLAHANHPVTAKDVFEVAKAHSLLLSVWGGRTDLAAQQRFGYALAAMRDRVFGSFRVRSAGRDSRTGNAAYRLEPVRAGGKTPETPETPINQVAIQVVQDDSGGGTVGVLGDDTTNALGDVGCFTETPVGSNQHPTKESKAYGVSGVSSVSESCWPTDSETDEEVIDL
jgi:hypothetical protein